MLDHFLNFVFAELGGIEAEDLTKAERNILARARQTRAQLVTCGIPREQADLPGETHGD